MDLGCTCRLDPFYFIVYWSSRIGLRILVDLGLITISWAVLVGAQCVALDCCTLVDWTRVLFLNGTKCADRASVIFIKVFDSLLILDFGQRL